MTQLLSLGKTAASAHHAVIMSAFSRRDRTVFAARCLTVAVLALSSMLAPAPASADRSGSTSNDRIARLYLGVFGRAPDLGGEAFWNHRTNDGITLRQTAGYFVDSPEFRERFGSGDDVVLTALYLNVLGRDPDPSGFAWWQQQIADGRPVSDVVVNFTESPENIEKAASVPSRYDPAPGEGCVTPIDDYLAQYIELMDKPVSIAVHDLASDCAYGFDNDRFATTASTFKLAVMGAMMLRAQDLNRSLSAAEQAQLDGMIRFSDDGNVGPIVSSMGGSTALLENYGQRLGISSWADEPRWGCVGWNADSATRLIEHLAIDGIGELTSENREIALGLLTNVTPSQRWGVGDGTLSVLDGTVAQKNGFARGCGTGSRINSVGLVLDASGEPVYSVAIYSESWVDGAAASRGNDQPAYVLEARDHVDHIAQHIARMISR